MMDAQELADRIIAIIKELDGAYRAEESANMAYAVAEETVKLKRAKTLLTKKAENGKLTGPELEALATVDSHEDRMEAIQAETQAKRAEHDCRKLDKELMAMQTLYAMEKVKLERGVDFK